ncbi:MAG: hypothetical protein H6712_17525 [Myxococcales bacterium]|nr:hypothetical protein [Myxococcales bacterium]
MRRALVFVLVATVVFVLWLVLRDRSGSEATGPEASAGASSQAPDPSPSRSAAAAPSSSVAAAAGPRGSTADREARQRMRERIVDALRARERAAQRDRSDAAASSGPAAASEGSEAGTEAPPELPEPGPATGGLVDRTGTRSYLVEVMNHDLMPLADECIALAREGEPGIEGMLVLDFEIIADEEIGGVVESVAAGQGNEVPNPELLECMRESILATTLPAPPAEQGGRDAISISLRLSPEGEG